MYEDYLKQLKTQCSPEAYADLVTTATTYTTGIVNAEVSGEPKPDRAPIRAMLEERGIEMDDKTLDLFMISIAGDTFMTGDIVGIEIKEPWKYDHIKPWLDEHREVSATEEAMQYLSEIDYEEKLPLWNKHYRPEKLLNVAKITRFDLFVKYDKNTLSYLLEKPDDVKRDLVYTVASGVRAGLQETLRRQRQVRDGTAQKDDGLIDMEEIERGIRKALENNQDLSSEFSEKELNTVIIYFARNAWRNLNSS